MYSFLLLEKTQKSTYIPLTQWPWFRLSHKAQSMLVCTTNEGLIIFDNLPR